MPGPKGYAGLKEGDLVRVADVPDTIDKFSKVPYPLNIRKITYNPEILKELASRDQFASSSTSTTATSRLKDALEVKAVVHAEQMVGPVGTLALAAPVPTSPPTPGILEIMTEFRNVLAQEYQAYPVQPDVKMKAEARSIPEQVQELEGQAAELLSKAAHLRQLAGMAPSPIFTVAKPPAPQPAEPAPRTLPVASSAAIRDPDQADSWELLQLR